MDFNRSAVLQRCSLVALHGQRLTRNIDLPADMPQAIAVFLNSDIFRLLFVKAISIEATLTSGYVDIYNGNEEVPKFPVFNSDVYHLL